jgi:hypothetical protein
VLVTCFNHRYPPFQIGIDHRFDLYDTIVTARNLKIFWKVFLIRQRFPPSPLLVGDGFDRYIIFFYTTCTARYVLYLVKNKGDMY